MTLELPWIDDAVGKTMTDTAVGQQLLRRAGLSSVLKIDERAHDHHADLITEWYGNHVPRHVIGTSHPGIESIDDDVARRSACDDVNLHFGITAQILEDDRRHHFSCDVVGGLYAQRTARAGAAAACGSDGSADLRKRRCDTAYEQLAGFRQRHAARGTIEQADAQSLFQCGHSMANRGARPVEFDCGHAEIAATSHSNYRFQFRQASLLHCAIRQPVGMIVMPRDGLIQGAAVPAREYFFPIRTRW